MSTIFDSIGIDPGIVIIILLIVVLVLIASTVSSNMRLTRLERKYKMFMKGSDAQSLEKTFVRKFAQIDHLFEAKEDHEKAIRTLAKHFKLLYSKYGVEKYDAFDDVGGKLSFALALLDSTDLPHPALEVLITVDEEIGLLGAVGLDCSVLKGKRMINMDSEAEGSLWISCAGGLSAVSHIPVARVDAEGEKLQIKVCGLMGGHSGSEIDKKRANANVVMGRFLYGLKREADYEIISMTGGQKDNAITREAVCDILVSKEEMDAVKAYASKVEKGLREEYNGSDKGISIQITEAGHESAKVLHPTSREKVLFYLMEVPFGIQKMSANIEGLVETSTNIGIVSLSEDEFFASSGVRSSVEAARNALSDKIQYLTEFLGGEYEIQGAYPAWEYRKESPLRDKMVEVYETMYGQKPEVVAIHAGLECGLFYKKIDGLDCVSLGPDMKDIHTSEEVLDIASTERVWKYLVKVLEELKD